MKWLIFILKRYGKTYSHCQSIFLDQPDQRYISH